MTTPIDDNAVYDLIFAAREALGEQRARSVRGETTLAAAKRALDLLMLGLLMASESGADAVPGVKAGAPRPPHRLQSPPA
jgi:hypothetical protein